MNARTWDEIVTELAGLDVDTCVRAAARLQASATIDDTPRLLALLLSDNVNVREAAAWPLAELVGPTVLQELFRAYQRGFDEGCDNDGFTAALLEIPALHREEACLALEAISSAPDEAIRSHANWLREFC